MYIFINIYVYMYICMYVSLCMYGTPLPKKKVTTQNCDLGCQVRLSGILGGSQDFWDHDWVYSP